MTLDSALALRRCGRHEEARVLLCDLAAAQPQNLKLQYEAACVHDFLGLESLAVPFYRACLAGPLSAEDRLGALLGLGSTLRTLGRHDEAEAVLLQGLAEFPEAQELRVFLAMVQHNLGRSKQAVESLLALLAETSADPGIKQYARALALYAQDIDRVWPQSAA